MTKVFILMLALVCVGVTGAGMMIYDFGKAGADNYQELLSCTRESSSAAATIDCADKFDRRAAVMKAVSGALIGQ